MEFILFIWPLMAYILKFIGVLLAMYIIGSWMANAGNKPSILRTILRYAIFIVLFPIVLIIGLVIIVITHPTDRL